MRKNILLVFAFSFIIVFSCLVCSEAASKKSSNKIDIQQMFKQAEKLSSESNYEAAIKIMSKIIALKPNYDKAYAKRGDYYYALVYTKDYRNITYFPDEESVKYLSLAIDDLSKAIALKPDNTDYYETRSNFYGVRKQEGDKEKAKNDFLTVLELYNKKIANKPSVENYFSRAELYFKFSLQFQNERRLDKKKRKFEIGENQKYYLEKMKEDIECLLRISPENLNEEMKQFKALGYLEVYIMYLEPEKKRDLQQKIIDKGVYLLTKEGLSAMDKYNINYKLGGAFQSQGQYEKAIKCYEAAIDIAEKNNFAAQYINQIRSFINNANRVKKMEVNYGKDS